MLLYFARGKLPWQGLRAATDQDKHELIKQVKTNRPVTELYAGLPDEFAVYINLTRSLGFNDKPNYGHLRRIYLTAFSARQFKNDNVFDWTACRFNEIYRDVGTEG